MKSEDKIIELLAQKLKKTDQVLDRMDGTERSVDIMSRAVVDHSIKFNTVNEGIKHLREEQGVMLNELLSISKRVSSIEERH
ncbi:MAG: hypothetical protein JNM78_13495 [Cyclobacteriaceae bacterium]|nr:hypothetical protein [Cyclobacteriaceae bacterium]